MSIESDHDLPPSGHEPVRRGGSIVLVLLVAGAIVAAAVAFMTLGRAQAQPYILALLALLAMIGLFNLFALAAGIIRLSAPSGRCGIGSGCSTGLPWPPASSASPTARPTI